MVLHKRVDGGEEHRTVAVNPLFSQDGALSEVPRFKLAGPGMPAETASQLIQDELMLDGNARLNLATFVTTWMEPDAQQLMAECADKNMIDKDEYPQTAEIERRCVDMLADLWHAPDGERRDGLLDDRLERGLHARRAGAQAALARAPPGGRQADRPPEPRHGRQRPGLLGEVLPLLGRRAAATCRWRASAFHLDADEARGGVRREHDRRRRRSWARRSTAATSRSRRSPRALDDLAGRQRHRRADPRRRGVRRLRRAVPRARPGVGLPAAARAVDQRLGPQVRAGLPGRRLGAVARRGRTCPRSSSSTSTTSAATCRPSR